MALRYGEELSSGSLQMSLSSLRMEFTISPGINSLLSLGRSEQIISKISPTPTVSDSKQRWFPSVLINDSLLPGPLHELVLFSLKKLGIRSAWLPDVYGEVKLSGMFPIMEYFYLLLGKSKKNVFSAEFLLPTYLFFYANCCCCY